MTSAARRLRIGTIATAHGVRGLVKVLVTADDPHLVETAIVFKNQTGPETISLTLKNPVGKYWVAEAAGVADRDAALTLRGTNLWIDRDALPDAEDAEYYAADLVGLNVIDENGAEIGTVIAVPDFGATPLLEIKPAGKASFYIPFTADVVKEENLEAGHIVVRLPEGLI
jgi:16S rRNA processing protein RimM